MWRQINEFIGVDGVLPEQYLDSERFAEAKSEWFEGRVNPWAECDFRHNAIAGNVLVALKEALRGTPLRVMNSQMRVKVREPLFLTYPDFSVIGEEVEWEKPFADNFNLLNPRVLIEIASPATEGYDFGAKFERYQGLKSLCDYIVIAQDRRSLSQFRRLGDCDWLFHRSLGHNATLEIESIGCQLTAAEVYQPWNAEDDTFDF